MAGHQGRPPYADRRADRLRQDARRLPGGDRRPGAAGPRRRASGGDTGRLRLAAQGAVERHPAAISKRRSPASARNCAARGLPDVDIRTWVRTGDTPPASASAWAAGRRISSSPRRNRSTSCSAPKSGRKMLATTRTVIVDEIHAVAPNKRGSHLALSLERLCRAVRRSRCCASACRPRRSRSRRSRGFWSAPATAASCADRRFRPPARRATSPSRFRPSPLEAVMSAEVWEQVYRPPGRADRGSTARR